MGYLSMRYTPSAKGVAQSYLARKPSEVRLLLAGAGQDLGGRVMDQAGEVVIGKLGREKVEVFSRPAQLIENFANVSDSKQILMFTRRYGVLRFRDVERLYMSPDDDSDSELGDAFYIHCDTWREDQQRFRNFWEQGAKGGQDFANELSKQITARSRGGPLVKAKIRWNRRGFQFELRPDDLWRALCLAFIGFSDRMRKCQNPTCAAPYFLATRRDQKFCNETCSRRVANRRWWNRHGAQWRQEKSEGKGQTTTN